MSKFNDSMKLNRNNIRVCIYQILVWGLQAGLQLLLIRTFAAALTLNFNEFLLWTFYSFLAWGTYFFMDILRGRAQAKAIQVLNDDYRNRHFQAIFHQEEAAFFQKDTGDYLAKVSTHVKQIEQLAWNPFFESVGRVAQIFWSIVALALIDWMYLLIGIVTAVVMWIVPRLFHSKMEKVGEENAIAQDVAMGSMKEMITGIPLFKSFGQYRTIYTKWRETSEALEENNAKLAITENTIGCIVGMFNVTLQIASEIFTVLLVLWGRIPIAVLAGGSNLIGGITNGFNALSRYRLNMAASRTYFKPLIVQENEETAPLMLQQDIVLDGVSYAFGSKRVLEDIHMIFERGKKYAIEGASGSGKTTVLRILRGELMDYEGNVFYDGVELKDISKGAVRHAIAYISQDAHLFTGTIRDNITLFQDFPETKILEAVKGAAFDGDLLKMEDGLETLVGEGGKTLSGGQRQRIAIARAILYDRKIILMDEGTSALDQANVKRVEEKLLAAEGLTLIMISHHLSSDRKMAFDHVYHIPQ